jgi:hypothetical protein
MSSGTVIRGDIETAGEAVSLRVMSDSKDSS